MKQASLSTSASASGFSAALVVILVWLFKLAHVDLPADVAAAAGTVIASITHYLVVYQKTEKTAPYSPTQGDVTAP